MNIHIVLIVFVGLVGMAFGSFLSVAIHRMHVEKTSWVKGRSHCPKCMSPLRWHDLIPLLSYLLLRGKCRDCGESISYMYPLMELLTGVMCALIFVKFPFYNSELLLSETNLWLFLLYFFYTIVLMFTFFYDIKYMEVSDTVLVPTIVIALIATIGSPLTPSLPDALIGAAIPVAFFSLQIILSKGKWIGGGDIRVGALMGAILGWQLVIVALFASYIIGSIVSIGIALKKETIRGIQVPFAPFLVIGTFVALFFGNVIIQWYLGDLMFL